MYTYVCIYIYIYMHIYIYRYIYVCVCIDIYIYIYIYSKTPDSFNREPCEGASRRNGKLAYHGRLKELA